MIKKIKQEPTLKYISSETLNNIITKYWNESITFSDFCDMYLNNDYDSDYDEDDDLKDAEDTVIKYRASKSKLCCFFNILFCYLFYSLYLIHRLDEFHKSIPKPQIKFKNDNNKLHEYIKTNHHFFQYDNKIKNPITNKIYTKKYFREKYTEREKSFESMQSMNAIPGLNDNVSIVGDYNYSQMTSFNTNNPQFQMTTVVDDDGDNQIKNAEANDGDADDKINYGAYIEEFDVKLAENFSLEQLTKGINLGWAMLTKIRQKKQEIKNKQNENVNVCCICLIC